MSAMCKHKYEYTSDGMLYANLYPISEGINIPRV